MAMKGILWSIVFAITFLIYITVPTYLIVTYWIFLNEITDDKGRPLYTYALLALFTFLVALIVSLIYFAAMVRALIQRKNEEGLGIPNGVKVFGLITTIIVVSLMVIWYILFNEIAIFSWTPP